MPKIEDLKSAADVAGDRVRPGAANTEGGADESLTRILKLEGERVSPSLDFLCRFFAERAKAVEREKAAEAAKAVERAKAVETAKSDESNKMPVLWRAAEVLGPDKSSEAGFTRYRPVDGSPDSDIMLSNLATPETVQVILAYEGALKKLEILLDGGKGEHTEGEVIMGNDLRDLIEFKKKHVVWGTVPKGEDLAISLQKIARVEHEGSLVMIPPGHSYLRELKGIAAPVPENRFVELRPDAVSEIFAAAILVYSLAFLRQFSMEVPPVGSSKYYSTYYEAYLLELVVLHFFSSGRVADLTKSILQKNGYRSVKHILMGVTKQDHKNFMQTVFGGPARSALEASGRNSMMTNSLVFSFIKSTAQSSQEENAELVDYLKKQYGAR